MQLNFKLWVHCSRECRYKDYPHVAKSHWRTTLSQHNDIPIVMHNLEYENSGWKVNWKTHPVKQIWLPCTNNTVVYSFQPIQGTLHKRKGFDLRASDKNIQYSKVEHHVQGFVHKMNKSIQSIVYEKCLYWLKFGCLPNWFLLKRWAFDVLLANGE